MKLEYQQQKLPRGALGNAIRQARLDRGLTQEELAELADITPTHLKHIESEHRKPSIEVLFQLVHILHFSLDNLFLPDGDEKKKLQNTAGLLLGQCDEKQLRIVIALLNAMLQETN